MKLLFNISLMVLAGGLYGQVRQEQDLSRGFSASAKDRVEISNKYGDVIIRTWDYDSVYFEVVVKAEGRNASVVNKSMDRTRVTFRKIGKVISASTHISQNSSLFGNVLSNIEGAIGSSKLTVSYEVWMPVDLLLNIENKYGDVYLASLHERVALEVSHGDIQANDFEGKLTVKHGFGKAGFGRLNTARFELRNTELDIDLVKKLTVESGSSEIQVQEAGHFYATSRNDKIFIDQVRSLDCTGSFTHLNIQLLSDDANVDFSYGDIYIKRLEKDFGKVNIASKSADVDLVLNQASYIKTYIEGYEDRMILPNSMLTMQKERMIDNEEKVSLSGFVGNTHTKHSELSVRADGGDLIIAIKETRIFVDKD